MFNMQDMMQQAQKVQGAVQELQEKFKIIEVEGQSGGGLVSVRMTCDGRMQGITIDPSLMTSDKETLEDLIVAATNNARDTKEQRIQTETEEAMKQLGLPQGVKLPI